MFVQAIDDTIQTVRVSNITKFADTICETLYGEGAPAALQEMWHKRLTLNLCQIAVKNSPIIFRAGPFKNQTQFVLGA